MQLVKDTVITLIIETPQLIYVQWTVLPISKDKSIYHLRGLDGLRGGGEG